MRIDGAAVPTVRLELHWNDEKKCWLLISTRQRAVGVECQRREIGTTEPLDKLNTTRVLRAIEDEMLSWLPYHEGLT